MENITIWVCSVCGSKAVQERCWVEINTQEVGEPAGDTECWCPDCVDHVYVRAQEEITNNEGA